MTPTVPRIGQPAPASELQRELEQVRALYRLTAVLARAQALPAVYEGALGCFEAVLQTTRASILLQDEAGVMRFVAWHRISDRYRAAVEGHSPWARLTRDPKPIAVPDVKGDPALAAYGPLFDLEGIRALLFVPISYGGALIGKFMAYFDEARAPSQRELELVEAVAWHVAVAVDRARADEALRRSRDELGEILANVADGVTVQDPTGRLVFANEAAARLNGFGSPAELLRASLPDVLARNILLDEAGQPLPPDALPDRIALRDGRPASATIHLREPATRAERWSRVTSTPLLDAQGKVRLAVNVIRDVTEQRQDEVNARFFADASALLASSLDQETTLENLARLAVPHIADWCGVELVGPDRPGATVPVAVAHVDPSKVALAHELRRRYPPDHSAPRGVGQVLRSGVAELYAEVSEELLLASAQDEEHLALLRALTVSSAMLVPLTARGRTFGVMTFALSDTPRRYGPADLSMAQELAMRAALAIDNARLFGEARLADERKDQFLAMLAHELRNPLSPIMTASHLARIGIDDRAQVTRALDVVDRQVTQLRRIVDDLLDVSRITRGKLELRREELDLAALARTTAEDHRPTAVMAGLELVVVVDEPLPVNGDPTRLAQVVGNLLQNSIKFTERGGRITVRAARSGDQAVIVVEDTGIGMSADTIAVLFEPFVQAERSLARTRGGLGLGLAVSRGIVELHGGRIVAASPGLGRGTQVTVSLTLSARTAPARSSVASPVPGAAGRRVLIVEDNTDASEMLATLLSSYGHDVDVASDGGAAIDAVRRFHPDVVLCDIGLPVLDGYQVADRLRGEHGAGLRLVALSGYAQQADRERSRAAGFDLHLTKPVVVRDLLGVLAEVPRRA